MFENQLRYRKNVHYAFLDFETFNLNLNFARNRPWQVGILEVDNETITRSLDLLVKWNTPFGIGREAAIITRYSQAAMDSSGISPEETFEQFYPILENCEYLVMHNGLRFDFPLLKEYCEYMGEDWRRLAPKIIDTKAIAQGIKMGQPFNPDTDDFQEYQYRFANAHVKGIKTNLKFLGQEFQIEHDYENLHNAVVDLQLNLKVWNKLKASLEY